MSQPKRLRFGRAMRLQQTREFMRARQQGRRIVQGCLIANWLSLPAESPTRLGVVTSSKIGNAVVRSRARRVLREVFRLHQHDLNQAMDMVLVARASIAKKGFAEVERDFLVSLQKAGVMKNVESRR